MNRKALFWPLAAVLLTACEKGLDEGIADVAPAGQVMNSVLLIQISYNLKMCPANLVRSESFSQFFAKIQIIFQSTKNKA